MNEQERQDAINTALGRLQKAQDGLVGESLTVRKLITQLARVDVVKPSCPRCENWQPNEDYGDHGPYYGHCPIVQDKLCLSCDHVDIQFPKEFGCVFFEEARP